MQNSLQKFLVLVFIVSAVTASEAQARTKFESFMWKSAAAATVALIATTNPAKADGVTLELGGDADGDFNVTRIGLQWDWNKNILELYGWKLNSYWQLEFSKWQGTYSSSQEAANITAGIIPVFRFLGKPGYAQPYFDVGIGLNAFTDSRLDGHEFGSNFQFSDVMAFGANVGKHNQWGFGYKFEHYSNGSVRSPNSGINFHALTLTYRYY